jgi:hypothetical protein
MYVQFTLWRISVNTVTLETQQYVPFLFFVGVDVAVNNKKVSSVAMERQQWVPFALLSSYKVFRTAVKNNKY